MISPGRRCQMSGQMLHAEWSLNRKTTNTARERGHRGAPTRLRAQYSLSKRCRQMVEWECQKQRNGVPESCWNLDKTQSRVLFSRRIDRNRKWYGAECQRDIVGREKGWATRPDEWRHEWVGSQRDKSRNRSADDSDNRLRGSDNMTGLTWKQTTNCDLLQEILNRAL
jgi:hypothetical protein